MTISEARLHQLSELLTQTAIEGALGLHYYPTSLIGQGGQGWVYKAGYDEPEGPWVVLKILRPDVVNEDALARFLREAEVLQKLGQTKAPSPNVVRYFDHGIFRYKMPDGEQYALPFIVLEFVHGQTLAHILEQNRGQGLAVPRVRRIFRQIARALSLIHAADLVHRDLKPSNLLISTEASQELVKITDFGLVKRFDSKVQGTMALAGASVGYAPPEQFEMGNRRVSPRTDLFAFATVLFEALTGKPAFSQNKEETSFQVLSRILSGPRPQLRSSLSSLSPELIGHPDLVAAIDHELERATRPDPNARHESILEFWGIIEGILRAATTHPSNAHESHPMVELSQEPVSAPQMIPVPSLPPSYGSSVEQPPASHGFKLRPGALLPGLAQAMTFDLEGRFAYALGSFGLLRSEDGVWSNNLLPTSLDPGRLRGLLAIPQGVLVFGEQGHLWGQSNLSAFSPWMPPDQDLIWSGAVLTSHPPEILLFGEHSRRSVSILGLIRPGQPAFWQPFEGVRAITAASRLSSGELLVCGEGGTLLFLGSGPTQSVDWGRTGHLTAVLPTQDGGAHIVGSGGHALYISPSKETRLEPVQTTRDLSVLTMTPSGPWAGGQDARLLRRTPNGWIRVPLPTSLHGSILALHTNQNSISVLFEDGQWWEGPLA